MSKVHCLAVSILSFSNFKFSCRFSVKYAIKTPKMAERKALTIGKIYSLNRLVFCLKSSTALISSSSCSSMSISPRAALTAYY